MTSLCHIIKEKISSKNSAKTAAWKVVPDSFVPDPIYRGFLENQVGPGTSFQVTFFTELFDEKFHFVILHKLAKFNYQTVITSEVIQ